MANISTKSSIADQAKTKAQLLAELNELRQRVAQWEAADPLNPAEERYRSVVTAMAEGVVMLQRSGEIVACNSAAEQILGLSREQMMGRTSLDPRWRAVHEDGTPFPGETHPAMVTLRTGQPQRNVVMGVHKPDGSLTWILINAEPMVQPGAGEPYAVVATFTDITQPVFDRRGNITGVTHAAPDMSERQRIETSLKEQEHNLRTFFNTIDDLLFVLDEQGCIQWCNQTVIRKLGYTETELQGQSVLMIHPPEWREEAGRIVRAMLEGQADYCPIPVLTKAGRQIPVETRAQPGQWSGQKVIFGVTKDLSDLKASEERFSKAFQASPALMAISELDSHRFIAVNDMFLNTTGYQRHEVIGHTSAELGLFVQDEQRAAALQLMQEQGYLRNFEVAMRAKSGEVHYGIFAAECLRLQDRKLLLTVMSDITERKRMEQALQESEARLKAVFELAGVGIRLSDPQGRWIQGNPALEQMLGYSLEELSHLSNLDLTHPDDRASTQMWMAALRAGQADSARLEKRYLHKDGRTVWGDLSVTPVRDEQGQVVSFIGVTVDVTGRKQAEAALRRSDMVQRAVLEAIPDFMFWTDRQGNYIPFHEFNLVSSEASNGSPVKKLNDALPQNVAAGILSRIPLAYETGEIQTFEYSLALQGKIRYYEAHLVNTLLDEILCILRDITARKQAEEDLRASEQKSRQIIEYCGDAIVLTDETGRIVEWNPAAEQLTGLTRTEMLGRTGWEVEFGLLPAPNRTPATYEQLKRTIQSYFQTGQSPRLTQPVEVEIQRPDGGYRDIQVVSFAIPTGAGFGFGNVSRDVTERKQTERIEAAQLAVNRILAESPEPEAALRQMLEAITVRLGWQVAHMWRLDSNGSRLVWQGNWCTPDLPELVEFEQISQGYTFEPGEGLTGAIWQTGRAIWDQDLHLVKGAPVALAVGLHSATGIPIIKDEVTVGVMTFFSRSARPLEERLLTTLTDLGRQIGQFLARKEAEASLRRYEQMISTSPDWMALIDRSYVFQIVNQAYLASNNKSYDQVIGHTVAELLGEAVFMMEEIKPYLDQALAGEMVHYQIWFDFPAVGQRFIDVTYAPYREKDGTIAGVIVSGRDMTETKLLEEHLQQAEKMGAIGQLAAGMAHHYNSMLTAIIGFTSLSLRTLRPDDPLAKNLQRVLSTAERMAVLVRQLLAFTQKQLLQFKTINLNELVRQLQGQLRQMVPAPIEFVLDLAPEVGEVELDPRQFEYLLQALISNAVDAMPVGGSLTLTTTPVSLGPVEAGWYDLTPGDYVLLTVKDTGIGLSDEVKAHLFEPFFTTKKVGQGTGLGLAMSLGIAKQHGGHLLAESQPGQGATFMLYLPCLAPPPPRSTGQPVAAKTILLIETEPMVREFVAEILSDQGYTVFKAANVEVALQLMADRPEVSLQLLLTPAHSNSPALVQQLQADSPNLKVIYLVDEIEELPRERVDFMTKPFTPSGLVQKIRAVLEAPLE